MPAIRISRQKGLIRMLDLDRIEVLLVTCGIEPIEIRKIGSSVMEVKIPKEVDLDEFRTLFERWKYRVE